MKFVIALIRHETNTFSPIPTVLGDFRRGTGQGNAGVVGDEAGIDNRVNQRAHLVHGSRDADGCDAHRGPVCVAPSP